MPQVSAPGPLAPTGRESVQSEDVKLVLADVVDLGENPIEARSGPTQTRVRPGSDWAQTRLSRDAPDVAPSRRR
jgi:hypothetical protein